MLRLSLRCHPLFCQMKQGVFHFLRKSLSIFKLSPAKQNLQPVLKILNLLFLFLVTICLTLKLRTLSLHRPDAVLHSAEHIVALRNSQARGGVLIPLIHLSLAKSELFFLVVQNFQLLLKLFLVRRLLLKLLITEHHLTNPQTAQAILIVHASLFNLLKLIPALTHHLIHLANPLKLCLLLSQIFQRIHIARL